MVNEHEADPNNPPWREWATARAAWAPDLSPEGSLVGYVSDRSGLPRAWVQPVDPAGGPARQLPTGEDHVYDLSFSPCGRWITVLAAPGGGATRTRVWLVRADGTQSRRIAGVRQGTASLGPWVRSDCSSSSDDGSSDSGSGSSGSVVALATSGRRPEEMSSNLLDVESGAVRPVAYGTPLTVLDISHDGTQALVRSGARGQRHLVVVPLDGGRQTPLLAPEHAADGGAEAGVFGPDGTVYARSDWGRERMALVAVDPHTGVVREVAARADGELDLFSLSDDGRWALLAWNIGGFSQVQLLDVAAGVLQAIPVPVTVVDRVRISRDCSRIVVSGQSPDVPRGVWSAMLGEGGTAGPLERIDRPRRGLVAADRVVAPTLEQVVTDDGLVLSGWLLRPPGSSGPGPATLWLHGGPEAQERPGFQPLFQALVCAGISVFAPNVRGSSGYGRVFEHADDVDQRPDAIRDVADCALHLMRTGIAEPGRLGVAGRSYGGYLTLAALTFYPELFSAGVDVCGMSDLATFFARTEPWIAAVSASKYGDPVQDRDLLERVSPLRRVDRLRAPLLVVHGANDRNVPVSESDQIVAALREQHGMVDYELVPDEGHELARPGNKLRFIECATRWLAEHLEVSVAEAA